MIGDVNWPSIGRRHSRIELRVGVCQPLRVLFVEVGEGAAAEFAGGGGGDGAFGVVGGASSIQSTYWGGLSQRSRSWKRRRAGWAMARGSLAWLAAGMSGVSQLRNGNVWKVVVSVLCGQSSSFVPRRSDQSSWKRLSRMQIVVSSSRASGLSGFRHPRPLPASPETRAVQQS